MWSGSQQEIVLEEEDLVVQAGTLGICVSCLQKS